jgi:hypothetical protein
MRLASAMSIHLVPTHPSPNIFQMMFSVLNVVSCKHGTQDVCTVNKRGKYPSMCKTVESVHAAVETQRRIFC